MTKLLEKAIETVRNLPADEQERIAQAMLNMAADEAEEVDPADLPGLLEGLADADAGRFSSDEEVERVFRRFDR